MVFGRFLTVSELSLGAICLAQAESWMLRTAERPVSRPPAFGERTMGQFGKAAFNLLFTTLCRLKVVASMLSKGISSLGRGLSSAAGLNI